MIATHITRRGFLQRATVAAGIIALSRGPLFAIADSLQPALQARSAVTYQFLEENYMRFMYGNCEPTLILTSLKDWEATRNLFLENRRVAWHGERPMSFRFNGADVAFSSKVPEGEFWYINEKYPEVPRYSGVAHL
jgi:hypothetical protein